MAKHALSFADKKLMGQVTDPEILVPRVPRFGEFFEGIEDMRGMMAEAQNIGRYERAGGFTTDRGMQRVATIPYSVWAALVEIDPEIGTNKKKFYEWLNSPEGQAYDTRPKKGHIR